MFSQSELNNYKLQVELLQEKLKRSEEHRQQLEDKFEYIMKRRSEHEKLVKLKSRLKCRQFLEEQRERNQRNKTLVQSLERIDQQAAVLAARSERVKILKIQYELYFSKVIQSHCPTRPIHPNYYYPASMPMNRLHFGRNSNQDRMEELLMPENDVVNFGNKPQFGSYRLLSSTSNTGFQNEPIGSNYSDIKNEQVNLKSPLAEHIVDRSAVQDLPNQFHEFANIQNPIDLNRYDTIHPKPIQPRVETNGRTSRSRSICEPDKQQQQRSNLNKTRVPLKTYSPDCNFESISHTYPQLEELLSEAYSSQNQPLSLDKLHAVRRDTTLDRLVAQVNNNTATLNSGPGEDEKSPPMYIIQGTNMVMPPDHSNNITDETASLVSSSQRIEKVSEDTSRHTLNFGGRIDCSEISYPLQTKKKEKLSIETIENEIYGKCIPSTTTSDLRLEAPENKCSDTVKIDSTEFLPQNESYEEKSDISEKVDPNKVGKSYVADVCKPSDGELIPTPAEISHEISYVPLAQEEYLPTSNQPVVYDDNIPNLQNEYLDPAHSVKEEGQDRPEQCDYSEFQNQDYQYPDPNYIPDQDSNYSRNLDPNYIRIEDPNYIENKGPNYNQGSDPNYIQSQEYDQSESYPAEYAQQQEYETAGYDQTPLQENIYPNEYSYNYDQPIAADYDPNIQQYSDLQYDQEQFNEPSYEQSEYIEAEYPLPQQQPMQYETVTSSALIPQEHDAITGQTEEEEVIHSAAATPQAATPSLLESPKPQSKPFAGSGNEKPASILSTTEKPHDSPIASKSKKKKRVNFVDNETEEDLSASKVNPSTGPNNDESDFDFSTLTN